MKTRTRILASAISILLLTFFNCLDLRAQQYFISYDASGNRVQFGKDERPELKLNTDTLKLNYTDTTTYLVVTNVGRGVLKWVSSSAEDWLTLNNKGNLSGDTLFIDVAKNTVKETRLGSIIFIDNDSIASSVQAFIQQAPLPNIAPEVTNPLDDLFFITGFNDFRIDLDTVFSDDDDEKLNYSVSLSSNTVVDTEINSTGVLTLKEIANGSAELVLTATDNYEGLVRDTVLIDVSLSAILATSVDSISIIKTGGDYAFDIINQGQEQLDWELSSLPDWITLEGSTTGTNNAKIEFVAEANPDRKERTAIIEIKADGARNSPTNITVIQEPRDNVLPVTSGIPDQSLTTGFSSYDINLADYFSDADGDALTYSLSLSNSSVISLSETAGVVSISEVGEGEVDWIVTAQDSFGGEVNDTVKVDVVGIAVMQVDREIIDILAAKTTEVITLTNGGTKNYNWQVATDEDWLSIRSVVNNGNGGTISFQAEENLITSPREGQLVISSDETINGSITIVVRQEARPNRAPEQIQEFDSYALDLNFTGFEIDLSTYFRDPDGDAIVYEVNNSNSAIVNARVVNTLLIINPSSDVGDATITVSASDEVTTITTDISFNVSLITEIEEDRVSKELLIYPNPAIDILNYDFSILGVHNLDLSIVNTQGRRVKIKYKTKNKGYLTLENITPGLYQLLITTKDKVYIKKFLITND